MMYNVLAEGLKEADLMTLRWNADVHTVHRKTGEYRILNNYGSCVGEIIKEGEEKYKIVLYGRMKENFPKETERVKNVSEMIVNHKINPPEYQKTKRTIIFPYRAHYQRNSSRHAA